MAVFEAPLQPMREFFLASYMYVLGSFPTTTTLKNSFVKSYRECRRSLYPESISPTFGTFRVDGHKCYGQIVKNDCDNNMIMSIQQTVLLMEQWRNGVNLENGCGLILEQWGTVAEWSVFLTGTLSIDSH